jgi:hypothetical protein
MKHIHERTGKEYEIGRLFDTDGRTYDINVITRWDVENDFEQSPVIIDYYFGDYDKKDTDWYIDQYLEQHETLKNLLEFLERQTVEDNLTPEDTKTIKRSIESVRRMITSFI